MNLEIPTIDWVTIPDWQGGSFAFLTAPGLLRFRLNGRVVFIGYAASPKKGVGSRIAAYRRGDVKTHRAAQQISEHKEKLELQIALLDLPPREIRAIAKELIRREDPRLNKKHNHPGRI
jgi:hypothetical protein